MKSFHKGIEVKPRNKRGSMEGALMWPATPSGSPPRGIQSIHVIPLDLLSKAPKGGFPKLSPKSTSTIHDDIFQRPIELKIFMWA